MIGLPRMVCWPLITSAASSAVGNLIIAMWLRPFCTLLINTALGKHWCRCVSSPTLGIADTNTQRLDVISDTTIHIIPSTSYYINLSSLLRRDMNETRIIAL
jgi:hypothetical protein